MIDKNVFYGADRAQTLAATSGDTLQGAKYSTANPTNLNAGIARIWTLVVGGGFDVNLPAANGDIQKAGRLGGPVFVLINESTSSTLTLKDDGGTTLETIAINKAIIIGLADNSTADGIWSRHILDVA